MVEGKKGLEALKRLVFSNRQFMVENCEKMAVSGRKYLWKTFLWEKVGESGRFI